MKARSFGKVILSGLLIGTLFVLILIGAIWAVGMNVSIGSIVRTSAGIYIAAIAWSVIAEYVAKLKTNKTKEDR